MNNSWVEFNVRNDNQNAKIKEYNRDLFNRIDVGVNGGLGYRLMKGKGISLGLNYYHGFLNVYKERSGTNTQAIFFKMLIPIGGVEKEE